MTIDTTVIPSTAEVDDETLQSVNGVISIKDGGVSDGQVNDSAEISVSKLQKSVLQLDDSVGTSDINTNSASYVDIADMSITKTTGANKLLIIGSIDFRVYSSVQPENLEGCIQLLVDSTVILKSRSGNTRYAKTGNGVAQWVCFPIAALVDVTAEEHTIKCQWKLLNGETLHNLANTSDNHRRLSIFELKND